MTRDEWISQCVDELRKLRPHLTERIVYTLAMQFYNDREHPRVAAREYHKRQEPPATPAPAKKRAK